MLARQDIQYLPHQQLVESTDKELEMWTKNQSACSWQSWLMPQMVAHFGAWQLVQAGGKIDVRETLRRNCQGNPLAQSLWRLTRIARSQLVKNQAKTSSYSQLVPLILLGFKRMQGIPYSDWQGGPDLQLVLEPKIWLAVALDLPEIEAMYSLGSERLLELRTHGLRHKGTGKLKSAQSTWSLTGMQGTEIGKLPKLTQTILTQIWLAHPQSRNSDMILDLRNWDHMPEPIVGCELFETAKTGPQPKKISSENSPWVPPWEETT